MNDFFAQFTAQAKALWGSMGAGPKVTAITFIGAGILIVVLLGVWSGQGDYVPIVSGLGADDTTAVTAQLKDEKINFRYDGDRGAILVPVDKANAARLVLASKGLPRSAGNGAGFEIFDKNLFAMTESVQNIQFNRALQTTLARNIEAMNAVQSARVQITPADEDGVYSRNKQEAKASVLLTLRSGSDFTQAQAATIKHLVACSVRKLDPRNITISDATGKLWARPSQGDGSADLSDEEFDAQKHVEDHYQAKIQSLLDDVLGAGRSVVRVSATMNFERVESTSTTHMNADNPLVTQAIQKTLKQGSAAAGNGGAAGQASNIPPGSTAAAGGAAGQSARNDSETMNTYTYDVKNEKRVAQVGKITSLSVAVLVAKAKSADGKETARTDDEKKSLADAVTQACAGAVAKPLVKLDEMPFATVKEVVAEAPTPVWLDYLQRHVSDALAVAGIIALLLVLRRMFAKLTVPVIETGLAAESSSANMPEGKLNATMVIQDDLKKMITQNNAQAVSIIRTMLGR